VELLTVVRYRLFNFTVSIGRIIQNPREDALRADAIQILKRG